MVLLQPDKPGRRAGRCGQALMELTFCLPVLILIMIAAYGVGAAMYTGANASSAVKRAVDYSSPYAASDTPIDLLKTEINNYAGGTFAVAGDPVDTVNLLHTDKKTVVVQASKSFSFAMLPSFTFIVTSGLPTSILRTNAGTFTSLTSMPFPMTLPASMLPPGVDPALSLLDPATLPKVARISKVNCEPQDVDIAVDFPAGTPPANAKALIKLYTDKALASGLDACTSPMRDDTNDVTFDATPPVY